jgi:benzoyl-CoA-dihydrodiol lyase
VDWRLVDAIAKPAQFAEVVAKHAKDLPANAKRAGASAKGQGVALQPLHKQASADSLHYDFVTVAIDRAKRTATLTVSAPKAAVPSSIDAIQQAGDSWYPLQMARELDDAILCLRSNELDIGTWLLKTTGDAALALQSDAVLVQHQAHWLVNETIGLLRRTLARLDVSSRSLFALMDEGSCFAGTLAELAFCADRAYMLALPGDEKAPHLTLSELNMGYFPMVNHQSRLQRRFYEETAPLEAVRAAMSPDSLTGLEANLRFSQKESMETRIFGRLSAWQNWIFNRPNAVGDKGALKVYGKGEKAAFDMNRV